MENQYQATANDQILKPPNEEFFQKYGLMTDKDSILARSQVLFIRHGLSLFNQELSDHQVENALISDKQQRHLNYMKLLGRNDLIDPYLHEDGILQAKDQQELLNTFKFRKVYVSPLRRTIMTAAHALATHPDKDKLSLVLLPLAKEITSSQDNLAIDYEDLVKFASDISSQFGLSIDFSLFEEYQQPDINLWYYQILTNSKVKEPLIQQSLIEHHRVVGLRAIQALNGDRLETLSDVFDRAQLLKQFINKSVNEEIKVNGAFEANEKILVVAHVRIIQAFFADYISKETGQPVGPVRWLNNCEIVPYLYDQDKQQ